MSFLADRQRRGFVRRNKKIRKKGDSPSFTNAQPPQHRPTRSWIALRADTARPPYFLFSLFLLTKNGHELSAEPRLLAKKQPATRTRLKRLRDHQHHDHRGRPISSYNRASMSAEPGPPFDMSAVRCVIASIRARRSSTFRTRRRSARGAFVTADVMLSPVSCANSNASLPKTKKASRWRSPPLLRSLILHL
jgi:hypothetical protein